MPFRREGDSEAIDFRVPFLPRGMRMDAPDNAPNYAPDYAPDYAAGPGNYPAVQAGQPTFEPPTAYNQCCGRFFECLGAMTDFRLLSPI